ncbi:hypothetical protein Hdeb2414_s0001g00025851 [Helianthus debilis subsp. tardiflorus]
MWRASLNQIPVKKELAVRVVRIHTGRCKMSPLLYQLATGHCRRSPCALSPVTNNELKKNPNESVLENNPVLIFFIPLGHSFKKKSSCPMYVNASPDPTKKNCGINQHTLSGTTFEGSSTKPWD